MHEARRVYPDQANLIFCESAHDALDSADALAINTEWQEFRSPDFPLIKQKLKDSVIFDGRNLYDPAMVEVFGLTYYGVGRGRSVASFTATI